MSIYIGDTGEALEPGEGDPSAVSIPVFHTGIFGQSGTGKTTLLKFMIGQAVKQGYRILIFDSKVTAPEFEGMDSKTIPFYLEQSSDPDVYRSLIEQVREGGKGDMEYFRGGFIEVCEPEDGPPAKDFAAIGRNLEAKLADSKHIKGNTRSMYRQIQRDHNELMKMLERFRFDERPAWMLDLDVDRAWSPILRLPIRDLPNLSLQGLVVKSVVQALLKMSHKLIVVVDEAPNFVNQRQYNPAKSALRQLDEQGRSKEIFGWYTGQTLSGFDKSNMKNLWYWIMGREMEKNEVKAVFDTQTQKVLTKDEVKQMKVRQFIVSTPDWAKLVTVPKIHGSTASEDARSVGIEKGMTGEQGTGRNVPPVSTPLAGQVVVGLDSQKTTLFEAPGNNDGPQYIEPAPSPRPARPQDNEAHGSAPTLRPMTEPIGAFTLQVTRLHSDSLEAKLLYLVKKDKMLSQKGMIERALNYGWVLPKSSVSDAVERLIKDGYLVSTPNGYRFPSDESFHVAEVPLAV